MTEIPHFKVRKPRKRSPRPKPGYMIRSRVWVEKDGELYLGKGRVMLLEAIDRLGSIAAAARSMRLGYRNAWLWIEAMDRLAPSPLVERRPGGARGGGARLTMEGHRAIEQYWELYNAYGELEAQVQGRCSI